MQCCHYNRYRIIYELPSVVDGDNNGDCHIYHDDEMIIVMMMIMMMMTMMMMMMTIVILIVPSS
jgi:hypothetical protein